jgi:non-heme chloroperoxidase
VPRITAPALLVQGEHSPALFPRMLDQLQDCLPACERVTIPAASHGMFRANPAACNEVALSFLARH